MDMQVKSLTFSLKAVDDGADSDGSFEAVLSTTEVDRDGETVAAGAFDPVPKSIPIFWQHGFTRGELPVGKGEPYYDGDVLKIKGSFAPTEKAQEVRTLVTGGFIDSMSAGFLTTKKRGKSILKADLFEGSVTATPVNTGALVLASKSMMTPAEVRAAEALVVKAGARNSSTDAERLQSIHDMSVANGATCDGAMGKAMKSLYYGDVQIAGTYEERVAAVRGELQEKYATGDADTSPWISVVGTTDAQVVYELNAPGGTTTVYRADYSWNDGEPTLGDPVEVDVTASVTVEAASSGSAAAAPAAAKAVDGAAATGDEEATADLEMRARLLAIDAAVAAA